MELSITTPALLFPAISLLMLAYTNRFLAIANLIRNLHTKYKQRPNESHILGQIKSLRVRLRLIRSMQAMGVLSFLFCVICMFTIFRGWTEPSFWIFAISIICFSISLVMSLVEITISTKALEIELSDIEEATQTTFFPNILKVREEKEEKEDSGI